MATYQNVDMRLWNDRKFLACSDDGRMLWLFLLTCPFACAIPGVIVAGEGAIADCIGWSVERVREGFAELFDKGFAIRTEGRIIWLTKAFGYRKIAGPNTITACHKVWDNIPEGSLKRDIWNALRLGCKSWNRLFEKLFPEPSNSLPNTSENGSANTLLNTSDNGSTQKQYQKQQQNQYQEEEERARRTHGPVHVTPAAVTRDKRAAKLASETWNQAAVAHGKLKLEGIDRDSPSWSLNPSPKSAGWKALIERCQELVDRNSDDEAKRLADHRVAVAIAEARAKRRLDYFVPMRMWSLKSFEIALSMSESQIGRSLHSSPASATPVGDLLDRAFDGDEEKS